MIKGMEVLIMEITLEAVEKVMEQTGVEYKTAKEALTNANGDVEEAIKSIQPETKDFDAKVNETIDKLKKTVEEGNVDKIQIRRDNEILLSVPVNVGIVGGLLGLAAAPWALIAGAVAAFGFGCKLEVVKKDGSTDEIEPEEKTEE
jgi:uncharacterized protein YPO0396